MESAHRALKTLLPGNCKTRDSAGAIIEVSKVVASRLQQAFYSGDRGVLCRPHVCILVFFRLVVRGLGKVSGSDVFIEIFIDFQNHFEATAPLEVGESAAPPVPKAIKREV